MRGTQKSGLYLMGLGLLLVAGTAFSADSHFAECASDIDKAITAAKAAVIPPGKRVAEMKRKRTVEILERAKHKILCSADLADGKKKCDRGDDDDDGTPKDPGGGTPKDPPGGTPKDPPGGTPKQ
ncbi:MAG TPA: hypothetical protein VHE30_25790 [Polyangiaceae bacterium]|nr:hypothetical protein [Polyangiaceae bacterium]